MKIKLSYDEDFFTFEFGDEFKVININVSKNPITDDKIKHNFDNPVEKESLFHFIEKEKKLLFIVSDGTRKTGSKRVIKNIFEYFEKKGYEPEEVRFLIATGIHRDATENEMKKIVGEEFFEKFEVLNHSAKRVGDYYGKTTYQNEIFLNEGLREFEKIIVIGNVGFHYFAGFSGGRKSILPGVARKETIERNHMLVFNQNGGGKNPEVRIAKLKDNPVNEDMIEAVKLLGREKIFSINTIVDEDENIVDLNCGEIITSHVKMCEKYKESHMVEIDEKRDIAVVSAGGYPRDINMIQTHKTIENGRYFIKEGGILIVLANCRDGFGNDEFFKFFDLPDLESFEKKLREKYVINGQTAMAIVEKAMKYKIILVSSLREEDVKKMRMIPAKTLKEAFKMAKEMLPLRYKGFIIPNGATTLPKM